MEIDGNNFIEVIENLKVKYDALNECAKVINVAQKEYEQYTNMYKKSQSLLANLEKDVMDIGDFPIELNTTYPRTGNHKTGRKDQGTHTLYTYLQLLANIHIYTITFSRCIH